MLFENVMAILERTEKEGLHDVITAEDMIAMEKIDVLAEIRTAGKFLRENYKAITKCNRLGMKEKIKEICDARDNHIKLKTLTEYVLGIDE